MGARRGVRTGAAAFVLGLSLVGPQAAGVAAADTDTDASAVTASAEDSAVTASSKDANGVASSKAARGRSGRAAAGTRSAERSARPAVGVAGAASGRSRGNGVSGPAAAVVSPRRSGAGGAGASVGVRSSSPVAPTAVAASAVDEGGEPTVAESLDSVGQLPEATPPALYRSAAPVASSAVRPTLAPTAVAAADTLNGAGVKFLDSVANWLAMLPNQKVGDLLSGALLLVRRNLFDQSPVASPVQETTTSQGQVLGTIGAIDPESDPLAYRVVSGPQFGTVEISADGHYAYTPGESYSGTDSFVVRIADTNGGINLLNPGAGRSTEVSIQVGAQASTDPFCDNNLNDAGLLLKSTPAQIAVSKKNGRLVGTITLNIADDTSLVWADEQGRTGRISAANVAAHWDGIQSAGNVMLGIDYTLDDGSEAAMIMNSVNGTYDGSGQYTFTGILAPDARDGAGVNSFWDVIGVGYKACYENFLGKNGIGAPGFRNFSQDIARSDVYLDTFSVSDYEQSIAGTDPGISLSDPAAFAGNARLRALATATAPVATPETGVTQMISYGSSLVLAQRDGSIQQWDGQSFTQLQGAGWESPVKSLTPYQKGFVVGLENGAVEQWDGTQWSELRTYNSESPLTALVAYGNALAVGDGMGHVQQWTGTEWQDLSNNWGSAVTTMAAYKTGFVVGLQIGAVEYWTGTGWQDLLSISDAITSQAGKVTALTTYVDDVVVGRIGGAVQQWNGKQQWDSSYWRQVAGAGSTVTTIALMGNSPVVGRQDGSVQKLTRDVYGRLYEQKLLGAGGSYFGPAGGSLDDGGTYFGGNFLGNTVNAGTKLGLGDSLSSNNGAYTLALQQDGNLVLAVAGGNAVWSTGTNGKGVDSAQLQSDGNLVLYAGSKSVWNSGTGGKSNVRLVVQDDRNVVLYDGGGKAVWASKTDTTAAAPVPRSVKSMLGWSYSTNGNGFAVGYDDGTVKEYRFSQATNAGLQFQWVDMGKKSSSVNAIARYSLPPSMTGEDGYYLGLDDGVVKRYDAASRKWFDMRSLPAPGYFNQDTLRQAVQFAQSAGKALSGTDPLFTLSDFQPRCRSTNTCDGSVYDINMSKPTTSLASTSLAFAGANQSIDLSYDLGTTAYGYLYVPGGIWKKLDPDQYSFGAMLAVTTGPSLDLNLGDGCTDNSCTLNLAQTTLVNKSWSSVTPYGVITLTGDVSAKLDAVLGLPDGFAKKKLTASAYLTGGVVLSYNTPTSFWNSGWNYYLDTNFTDFTNLTSVSLIPTLTPTLTGSWGLTVPAGVPIAGGWSLASVSLGYSNPIDINLTLAKASSPSLTIGSSGALEFSAGFVPDLTSSLTYKATFPLYSVRTGNLLA